MKHCADCMSRSYCAIYGCDAAERTIVLAPADFEAFVRELDNPKPPTKALVELLRRKPIWND